VLGHGLPLGGTVSLDDTGEDGVLLRRPLAIVIELVLTDQLIVSLMSLEQSLVHFLRNKSELLDSMEVDQEQELLILFFGPDWRLPDVIVLSLSFLGAANSPEALTT